MGCHTWHYKKVNVSFEEMKQKFIDKVQENIESAKRLIYDRDSFDADVLEAYPEWTPEFGQQELDILNDILKKVNNDEITKEEMFSGEYFYLGKTYVKETDSFYDDVDDYHDTFRKYGYPDDMLFSLEETIRYITDPINECQIYPTTHSRIIQFWKDYPDGMIDFG